MNWVTYWATFSQTHLVTLHPAQLVPTRRLGADLRHAPFFKKLPSANLLADEVNHGLGGHVLLALRVDVDEVELHVRQQARAVVDPLDGVAQSAGNGTPLPESASRCCCS
jgi:hypothetical protein